MKLLNRLEDIGRRLAYLSPSGKSRLGPRWIVLVVNNTCNLHCRMCDVGTGASDTIFYRNLIGDGHGDMTIDLFERILADAARFPLRPKLSLSYTEPGIHPSILGMVQRAKAAGFYCSLTTNGFTLPRLAEQLVQLGLDEIFVSVDGPREIHNDVRGSVRSYDRIKQGLHAVADFKTRLRRSSPTLNIVYVFTEESYLSLVDLLEDLREVHPDQVVATLLNFIHPDSAELHNVRFGDRYPATVTNLHKVNLGAFDFEAFMRQIAAARVKADELGIYLNLRPNVGSIEALRGYFQNVNTRTAGDFCSDPWNMVMIQTNGDVIPAHGRCFNTVVGNLESASLQAIWNGRGMVDFRRLLKSEGGLLPACTRCCGCFDHTAGRVERTSFAIQKIIGAGKRRHASASGTN
jgi:MoaA/NifB/PqqE/SkfB family radical SAM enzyme